MSGFDLATVRDSWVRRCGVKEVAKPVACGIEEGEMKNRERMQIHTLEISREFEPSRVAEACMEEAFERVLPTRRVTLRHSAVTDPVNRTATGQRMVGE